MHLVDCTRRSSPEVDSLGVLDVRVCAMRTGIVVEVTAAERDRLEAIVADRNSPQKHVWRAGIVLATADGLGTVAIMRTPPRARRLSGAGRNGLPRRASMACCATRPGPRGVSPSAQRR